MVRIVLGVFMLAASGAALAAQLYRWVDDKGNVEYRDTPPPSSAKKVEQRSIDGGTAEHGSLPFSMQLAIRNFPVTLWSSSDCEPCDQARRHLARRGVPYTEKRAEVDPEAFQKLTGGLDVPVLYVGSIRLKKYLASEWDSTLDLAGYPRTPPPGAKPAAKAPVARAELPPVKLYTHPDCSAECSGARNLLASRGIQFEEVVAQEAATIEELRQVSGDTRVPVLLIGKAVMRGFHEPNYQDLLDSQGFPRAR